MISRKKQKRAVSCSLPRFSSKVKLLQSESLCSATINHILQLQTKPLSAICQLPFELIISSDVSSRKNVATENKIISFHTHLEFLFIRSLCGNGGHPLVHSTQLLGLFTSECPPRGSLPSCLQSY